MTIALILIGFVVLAGAFARGRTAARMERDLAARLKLGPEGVILGAEGFVLPNAGAPALLLLHGGGDTPQTLRYLAEYLHERGYAVSVPLLPGHGRTLRDFARSSADDWLRAARESLDELAREHPWVGIVGLSMGGAIAVQLAAETPSVRCLVLLAPYLAMPADVARAARLAWAWGVVVPYVDSTRGRSIHDGEEATRSLAYGVFAAPALRALHVTVRRAVSALPKVQVPTLVIQSRQDNRIEAADAQRAFELLRARPKEFIWVDGAGHVITVDFGRERIFQAVADWLETHRTATQTEPEVERPAR